MSYGLQQNTTVQFCRDDASEFVELQSDLREIATSFFYSYLEICRRVTARLISWYRYSTESPAPSPTSVINYIRSLNSAEFPNVSAAPFHHATHPYASSTTTSSPNNSCFFFVVVVLLFYVHGKHLRPCRDGQLT